MWNAILVISSAVLRSYWTYKFSAQRFPADKLFDLQGLLENIQMMKLGTMVYIFFKNAKFQPLVQVPIYLEETVRSNSTVTECVIEIGTAVVPNLIRMCQSLSDFHFRFVQALENLFWNLDPWDVSPTPRREEFQWSKTISNQVQTGARLLKNCRIHKSPAKSCGYKIKVTNRNVPQNRPQNLQRPTETIENPKTLQARKF